MIFNIIAINIVNISIWCVSSFLLPLVWHIYWKAILHSLTECILKVCLPTIFFTDSPHINIVAYPLPNVTEGSNVSLVCEADANPNVDSYRWYYNDIPEQLIGRSKRLDILNINRSQAGNYTCIGQNYLSESTDKIPINVFCKFV